MRLEFSIPDWALGVIGTLAVLFAGFLIFRAIQTILIICAFGGC